MKARWQALKKRHWESRAVSERRAIFWGALALSPIVVYFLLWQPAHDATVKLGREVPLMRAEAAHLRVQAAEAERLRHQARPAVLEANALKAAIDASAVRHQLRAAINSIDTDGSGSVRITLAAVSFEQWVGFLRDLQQEQHIRADAANVASLPTAGMVKASATLVSGEVP